MINEVRVDSGAQLCLTNTAMQQQYITNVLAWMAQYPGWTIVSVAQNDNSNYCQCPVCTSAATAEGSQAGPLIQFVNAVAKGVNAVYPNVKIETLAYDYGIAPPKITKPASNVMICFCDITADFVQPLTNSANASMQTYLSGWEAITPASNLWVWDYTADFANYIVPYPNLNVFGPNITDFVAHNVTGVFEEGDYGSTCGDFCRLKCWVLAHLLWNPSLSETTLVNEFLNGYYGAAAPYISSYLTAVYNAATAAGYPIYENNTNYNFLTLSVMNQATQLLDSAAAAVAGDPVLSARVQRDSLPLEQAWVLEYPALKQQQVINSLPFYGPTDQVTGGNSFISACKAEPDSAGQISEGTSLASYAPVLLSECRPVATVPSQCAGLTDWVDIPNNMFSLWEPGAITFIVADSAASTGQAAEIVGNNTDWAVMYAVPSWIANAGKWQCYAVVRCACNGTTGNAFKVGIYNYSTSSYVVTLTPTLASGAKDGLYHTYDLGTYTLTPAVLWSSGTQFWFSPVNNPSVTAVYVDRIFLVPG